LDSSSHPDQEFFEGFFNIAKWGIFSTIWLISLETLIIVKILSRDISLDKKVPITF